MTATPPRRLEQFLLVVFFCAAVAAFGSSYQQPAIWIFWLPAALSMFWRLNRAPKSVVHALRNFSWTLLGVSTVLGLVLMAYAVIISESTAKVLTLLCGYGLATFGALFLLGTPVWPVAEAAIPAAIGLLLVAAFNPTAKITPLLVAPGAAAYLYLLLTRRDARPPWRLLSLRLVVASVASAFIAWCFFAGLPPLQGQVEITAIRWMMGETGGATPAATQSSLGDLEELQLSKRLVMRVWTTQPQKLRGRVFARFNGKTWQAHITRTAPLQSTPSPEWLKDVPGTTFVFPKANPAMNGLVTTRIVQVVHAPGALLSPPNKVAVRAPIDTLSTDASGNLVPPLTATVAMYGVVNHPSTTGEESAEAEFLGLPPKLDPRWRALADKLAAESSSTDDRIARTVEYVKNAATYSLQVGAFRTSDPVTEFFFEKKRGYCQYFATSAALLLRLQGIPARYVTGYVVEEYNSVGGHYVVRDADAHAWIEVFTPQGGWREADPTPEAEFVARREANESGRIAQAIEFASAWAAEFWVRLRESDWSGIVAALGTGAIWIGFALLVGLITVGAWFAFRFRKRPGHHQPSKPVELPSRLRQYPVLLARCWEAAGYPRPASRGLREHAEQLPEEQAELRALSRQVVDAYYRGSFGAGDPASDDLQELDELTAQLTSQTAKKAPLQKSAKA